MHLTPLVSQVAELLARKAEYSYLIGLEIELLRIAAEQIIGAGRLRALSPPRAPISQFTEPLRSRPIGRGRGLLYIGSGVYTSDS
jgi:hypothetical protein